MDGLSYFSQKYCRFARFELIYVLEEVPEVLRLMGRTTVKAFGVGSRFVHFEFFRLTKEKPGLGEEFIEFMSALK